MCDEIYGPILTTKLVPPTMIQVRFRKLFVGGIDSSITESDLINYFEKFGTVTGCTIHRDRDTGRSRGFGFITFQEPASVDAVQLSRPHIINGCEVTLKRAVPREFFQEFDGLLTVNRIFVGGLRSEIQESDIREYFSNFGKIRKVDIMMDRNTNTKRGFAFVEFDDYDPVDKAVLQGNHVILGQDVTVRKAKSRLEMELLRQRIGLRSGNLSPLLRRKSTPFQLNRAFGSTLGALGRPSLDSMDCPFHFDTRRRGRFC
ncbi:heterogeneous nuclear ribonucleoproteins A2/B1-like [Stegodyphus dumicola]|uniref:heterogeneous nuclear ribonucleoproteins A2/B1-like n=1 Tax=Stegodyphus dumicola TaxID=202533 RepID=UPI0015A92416|nr:heterogeneous nuclear ribonucleoproteins A2/B1-like [Stegodyphus dumicola]